MDPEPEVIRQQIEQTRESLTDKLETLEGQVRQTISSVTSTVEQTVDTVKSRVEDTVHAVTSAVEDTVDSVKRTFDVPYQVRRHPYLMTGGALAVGAALGYFLGGQRRRPRPGPRAEWAPSYTPPQAASAYEEALEPEAKRSAPPRQSFFAGLAEPLRGEFDKIKATAIGALLGMVRDAAARYVPSALASKVEEIINDVTRRAGGEVVSGPILSRDEEAGGR